MLSLLQPREKREGKGEEKIPHTLIQLLRVRFVWVQVQLATDQETEEVQIPGFPKQLQLQLQLPLSLQAAEETALVLQLPLWILEPLQLLGTLPLWILEPLPLSLQQEEGRPQQIRL